MKQMYKVTFSYKENDCCGTDNKFSGWRKETIPIEAEDDSELQAKIAWFKTERNWYREYIEVVDVTKL